MIRNIEIEHIVDTSRVNIKDRKKNRDIQVHFDIQGFYLSGEHSKDCLSVTFDPQENQDYYLAMVYYSIYDEGRWQYNWIDFVGVFESESIANRNIMRVVKNQLVNVLLENDDGTAFEYTIPYLEYRESCKARFERVEIRPIKFMQR